MNTTNQYWNVNISNIVKSCATKKSHRIRVRHGTPYVTYERKTRVLFTNPVGGAYINVGGNRVYFL